MKVLQFDPQFIIDHIDDLVQLEDYVPEVSFIVYDKHHERDDFLRSKNLLKTMRDMEYLLNEKCKHSKNPIRARDTIIMEWLVCHSEFKGIIARESLDKYQQLKGHYEDFTFIDLLYDVELPFEEKSGPTYEYHEDVIYKDDSNRMFPDFNRKKEIYEKYGASLLACYLSYLV